MEGWGETEENERNMAMEEIMGALKKIKSGKAAGMDWIWMVLL